MANLAKIEFEYAKKKLVEPRRGVLTVASYFLNNHLLKWYPEFKANVIEHAEYHYYKQWARFLEIFLLKKQEELNGQCENTYNR